MLPGIESEPVGMQTTHFSVLDSAGNRVAATISVNLFFGTGYMARRPACCSTTPWMISPPSPADPTNSVGGATPMRRAKQAQSVQHVADLRRNLEGSDDRGLPGGSFIISMVLLGTLNYLDGMNAADIVKYPRYHHQYLPDEVDYESGALSDGRNQGADSEGALAQSVRPAMGQYAGHHLGFRQRHSGGRVDPRGEGVGLVY